MNHILIKFLFLISAIFIVLALNSIVYFFGITFKEFTFYPIWFSVLLLLYFILPKKYNYFQS